MRIYIIGPSGSGKSWMAKELSKRLGIPHIQIDLIWAKSGGMKTYGTSTTLSPKARDYIIREGRKAMEQPSWVLDGNYRSTVQPDALNMADIVIMMDVPFWRRVLNNIKRHLSGEDHRRGFTTRHFLTRHLPRLISKGSQPREGQLKTAQAHKRHYIVDSRRKARELIKELEGKASSKRKAA